MSTGVNFQHIHRALYVIFCYLVLGVYFAAFDQRQMVKIYSCKHYTHRINNSKKSVCQFFSDFHVLNDH